MQSTRPSAASSPAPAPPAKRYTFSYGVNMLQRRMQLRCGAARPVGLARLPGHTWIVNAVGLANVVPTARLRAELEALCEAAEASADVPPWPRVGNDGGGGGGVYGVLYELASPYAEEQLDLVQDVPRQYQKRLLEVELIRHAAAGDGPRPGSAEVVVGVVKALVYLNLDKRCIIPRWPRRKEAGYARKMNEAIAYARQELRMPDEYVRQSLRPTIAESVELQRYSKREEDPDEILLPPILDQIDVGYWR
ncbi:hypothetical protein RB594_005839 [Gaeumannomyces avenae]